MRTLLAGTLSLSLSLALLVGLALAFAGVLHRAPTPWLPRPPVGSRGGARMDLEPPGGARRGAERGGDVDLWVADRAGGAIHGLDRDLFPVRALEVPCPVALSSAGSHGLWVASAIHGSRWGPHVLALLDLGGQPRFGLPFGTIQALHPSHAGGVFVHHLDRERRRAVLEHVTVHGMRTTLVDADWFDAIGASGQRVVVATQGGWLRAFDLGGGTAEVGGGAMPGPVTAIASEITSHAWWVAWRAPPRVGETRQRGRLSRVTLEHAAHLVIEDTLRMPFLVSVLLAHGPHLWAFEQGGSRMQRIRSDAAGPHPVVRLLDGPCVGALAPPGATSGCIAFTAEALLAFDGDATLRTTQGTFRSVHAVVPCWGGIVR